MNQFGCRLAACLIVRDESADISDCLRGLRDVGVDVLVYDTGSEDETPELARAAGASVVAGYWDDHFAAARNRALAATIERFNPQWVLSLDADDRVRLDADHLLTVLAATPADAFRVPIHNVLGPGGADSFDSFPSRLFRAHKMRWYGRIHERIQPADGSALRVYDLPDGVLTLSTEGYAHADDAKRKAARNATLGLAEVNELVAAQASAAELARVLLDLGRSLMAAGENQGAMDAFAMVRALPESTEAHNTDVRSTHSYKRIGSSFSAEYNQATDFSTRLALADNQPTEALHFIAELRTREPRCGAYCDWLQAHALAQLGDAEGSYRLLCGIHELIDPAGRRYAIGKLIEMRALAAHLAGRHEAALCDLITAMRDHGRIEGRGSLLLEWWGERSRDELSQRLSSSDHDRNERIQIELSAITPIPVDVLRS